MQLSDLHVGPHEAVEWEGLHIVGFDDLRAGRFDLAAGLGTLPARAAAMVLSHHPDTAGLPGWGSYSVRKAHEGPGPVHERRRGERNGRGLPGMAVAR